MPTEFALTLANGPAPVDNLVNLDASQSRGSLTITALEPDYTAAYNASYTFQAPPLRTSSSVSAKRPSTCRM